MESINMKKLCVAIYGMFIYKKMFKIRNYFITVIDKCIISIKWMETTNIEKISQHYYVKIVQ